MIILLVLLVAVVVAWVLLSPLILPEASAARLDSACVTAGC